MIRDHQTLVKSRTDLARWRQIDPIFQLRSETDMLAYSICKTSLLPENSNLHLNYSLKNDLSLFWLANCGCLERWLVKMAFFNLNNIFSSSVISSQVQINLATIKLFHKSNDVRFLFQTQNTSTTLSLVFDLDLKRSVLAGASGF